MTLLEGDYQVTDDLIFERKSYSDFNHSIIDGRLFKQVKRLKENFKTPVIILEGGPDYSKKSQRERYLPRDTILGACLSVINSGVSIVPTLSQADTARLIIRSAERVNKTPTTYRVSSGKKATNCHDLRRQIIETFPGIGAKTAKKIADSDLSLIEIMNAIFNGNDIGLSKAQAEKARGVLIKC